MNEANGIFIDKRIFDLTEPMIYGKSSDLLWRPPDDKKADDLEDIEMIYDTLLGAGKAIVTDHNARCQGDGAKNVHVQTAFIFQRRPVIIGILFQVEDGEPVYPKKKAAMHIIRQQIGRNWN